MRKRFEQQLEFGAQLIPEVEIDKRSRDQLSQLLSGLQYIFLTKEVNEKVFKLLEDKILAGKKETGRTGMTLWEILVLGSIRQNLDIDYDRLHHISNFDMAVRGIMGVHNLTTDWEKKKYYPLQTIKDNVVLLDEETMDKISGVVVEAGHKLKKNEDPKGVDTEINLELKTDSYAVETTIHFPTDIWLLWDSVRKSIYVIDLLKEEFELRGWGKIKVWFDKSKKAYNRVANIHRKKGKNYKERLEVATKDYLSVSNEVSKRVVITMVQLENVGSKKALILLIALKKYHNYLLKLSDQVDRRLLQGEKIPHAEKIFSIFEEHTEWLAKGKIGRPVELGHNVQITTDQYHFIVDHKVMVKEVDKETTIELGRRLGDKFGQGYKLSSISFDRGFYSKLGYDFLSKQFELVVMPKPGKKSGKQESLESAGNFVEKRKKHSAVEANINELEHCGANKVPDKGLHGFKRYVGWSVLSYNLKRLGKIVMEQELLSTVKYLNAA